MAIIYGLGTFSTSGSDPWPGVVCDGVVAPLVELLDDAPGDLLSLFRAWPRWSQLIDTAMVGADTRSWRPESELSVHLPYRPDNLIGSGANYRKHVIDLIVDKGAGGAQHMSKEERRIFGTELMDKRAREGKPYAFVALRSAIGGPTDELFVPYDQREPDWEIELAVVIGMRCRRVSRADAMAHVAGYTIANDITARELVDRPDIPQMGMDWLSCKSAPGFKVLGPYITPARFVADPQKLHLRLKLNGQTMQDEGTDDMIFDVARLIEFMSAHAQLEPGDIIMTGSPSGNGTHYGRFLQDGDVMVAECDGLLGAQRTTCRLEVA
ncbi:MAG: fumarylacetoacetate hydrolase family protein [Pseudomonadota bacterium]